MNQLEGKVALVTGGGQGLGEAICKVLSAAGMKVVVGDIHKDKAQQVANELTHAGYVGTSIELDVRDLNSAKDVVANVAAEYGAIDVLINNAGIDKTVAVDELDPQEWEAIIATNLTGPFLLSRYVLPHMKKQFSGQIINIVSTAAKRAWPNASAYHASKWGLLGFSHALHTEGRAHGVKVTAVVTGGMRTPFLLDRFPDIDRETLQPPENVAEVIKQILMLPVECVIPEITVLPMRETSWP